MRTTLSIIILASASVLAFGGTALAQVGTRDVPFQTGSELRITNLFGRVVVRAVAGNEYGSAKPVTISVSAKQPLSDDELKIEKLEAATSIEVAPKRDDQRVDLEVSVPERARVNIRTADGEAVVTGDLEQVKVRTDTGTIAVDVPTANVVYDMTWTESRPRKLSDFELEPVKERSRGRFTIKGSYRDGDKKSGEGDNPKGDGKQSDRVALDITTGRGIVLINVPPGEVNSDLRERPLTEAAKAIIRSGDILLTDAIRRASPKYFGEYARTLPPLRREPELGVAKTNSETAGASVKQALVSVTDLNNRAIVGLKGSDFEVSEGGEIRTILSVEPSRAPVNLVLLLDVSGSVETYVNFIRKAARAFVNTVDAKDRIAIVTFNEDVKVLSTFTTGRSTLSASLDSFDAGGGTAYYDALAYTLSEVLRPLKGERTAIVVLSDGDDNRSFLPFDSLMGSIQESGALIYPLYVPTSLIERASVDPATALDPLRSRYMSTGVTSKANEQGKKLAAESGGVYYPITQLSQIQAAYADIARQLRSSYDVKFRSGFVSADGPPSPRLKVRTLRENTFAQVRSVRTIRLGQ